MALTKDAIRDLQALRTNYVTRAVRDVVFDRMQYVDRCIVREANRSPEYIKNKTAQRAGKRGTFGEFEVPEVFSQVDTAHARLIGLFLTGNPIIGCATEVEALQDPARMLNALSKRDELKFGFVPQLSIVLLDAMKYPYCAAKVEYASKYHNTLALQDGKVVPKESVYTGNEIRRLDPYNVFFDPTVPLHEVHSRGAYAGYVEAINYINLKLFLQSIGDNPNGIRENFSKALSSSLNTQFVRNPDYAQPTDNSHDSANHWAVFWGNNAKNKSTGHSGKYEYSEFYIKLIPAENSIRSQKDGTPTIYKLIWINDILVYAEPLQNAHGMLPIVIGSGYMDGRGVDTKSAAEQLTDFQEALSAMINATFKSMRRAVSDRALFDPQRIRPTDIASDNPSAKIAVKLNQFNKDLSSAYYAIPYRDDISGNFVQNFGLLKQVAQSSLGLNPAAQGTFVKGNRTQTEYQDVQSNSDSRSLKFALNLENTIFLPIKEMMKMNYLQFSTDEDLMPQDNSQPIKIDMVKLRNSGLSFNMTDGLMPASKVISEELLIATMNTIAQMPQLDMTYSRPRMFIHMLKSKGLNLDQYRATPQEQEVAKNVLISQQTPRPTGGA